MTWLEAHLMNRAQTLITVFFLVMLAGGYGGRLIAASQAQPLAAPHEDGPLSAEVRDVLGRFVGDWDVVVTLNNNSNQGKASAQWSLENTYVEFRSHTVPAGDSDLQVMTYDDGAYHQWLFDSSGYRHEATGDWDASTSTLTWRGPRLLIEDHWVSPDRLEWILTRDDRRIIGVVTRRAPTP